MDIQIGGATADDGTKESDLNLAIAKKLEKKLTNDGFLVVMTRNDENNIADKDKQDGIREIKVSDINNRIKIANTSNAVAMISIHMNKFTSPKYRGWQTFYAQNSKNGKKLAESIQEMITKSVLEESNGKITNTRSALKIENIKIIDKTLIPTVIVECGFLSNGEELKLLQDEKYQETIATGVSNGLKKYLLDVKEVE